jgi:hypothetical protein
MGDRDRERGVTSIFNPPDKPDVNPLTTMRATVPGKSVVFGPTADGFCLNKASYGWKVAGRTLVFTAANDECAARRVLLTAGTWTRG